MSYDDLFKSKDGGWFEGVSPECRSFLEELTDEVMARGEEPTWAEVRRRIIRDFPEDATKTIEPIQRAVRSLIADRE